MADPSMEPVIFGRYRLLERLGRGGMGSVYLAELRGPAGFTRLVALKRLNAELSGDETFLRAFMDEARLGGLLSHQHIVQVLDFGEIDGHPFLVMEHVDGESLEPVILRARHTGVPLPVDVCLRLTRQVCEGLRYAHQAVDREGRPLQVVHRDLKPSNVLLDRTGRARVADFGIARAESNLTVTRESGPIRGTARYLSPEQALGMREIDGRSDLFAVGLLLYELLTGVPFNDGATPLAALRFAESPPTGERLERLPSGPLRESMAGMLEQVLARDPALRPSSTALISRLQALIERCHPPTDLAGWSEAQIESIRVERALGPMLPATGEAEGLEGARPGEETRPMTGEDGRKISPGAGPVTRRCAPAGRNGDLEGRNGARTGRTGEMEEDLSPGPSPRRGGEAKAWASAAREVGPGRSEEEASSGAREEAAKASQALPSATPLSPGPFPDADDASKAPPPSSLPLPLWGRGQGRGPGAGKGPSAGKGPGAGKASAIRAFLTLAALLLLAGTLRVAGLLERPDTGRHDAYAWWLVPAPSSRDVAIVDLDDGVEPWPWRRATLARLIERLLMEARARVVVVDVLLSARPPDAAGAGDFAAAHERIAMLGKDRRVVLALSGRLEPPAPGSPLFRLEAGESLPPPLSRLPAGHAAMLAPDAAGEAVRRLPLVGAPPASRPASDAPAPLPPDVPGTPLVHPLSVMGAAAGHPVAVDLAGRRVGVAGRWLPADAWFGIELAPVRPGHLPLIPASELLRDGPLPPGLVHQLEGRHLVLGRASDPAMDRVATPWGYRSGVEVQATQLASILSDRTRHRAGLPIDLLLQQVLLGMVAIQAWRRPGWARAWRMLGLAGMLVGLEAALVVLAGVWVGAPVIEMAILSMLAFSRSRRPIELSPRPSG